MTEHNQEDLEEIDRLTKEFDEAVSDALDAQSRAASAADDLQTYGVDIFKLRPEAANI